MAILSKGNTKLGKIPQVNLSPVMTCKKMPCLTSGCYSMKGYKQYPSCRTSWTANVKEFLSSPDKFFQDIMEKLQRKKNRDFFRWHSAGEIPNNEYFEGMKKVASVFPKTRFLVFTKKYGINTDDLPGNLTIVFSTWPNLKIPEKIKRSFPIAWMEDGTQKRRIQENAKMPFVCMGDCRLCKVCWFLNERKHDVIFPKH